METVQTKVGIVAFSFGEPVSVNPNKTIASRATTLAELETVNWISTDRDVCPYLPQNGAEIKELDSKLFPHTYRLAIHTIELAIADGVTKLYVVAAPAHIWRCLRDLRWVAEDRGVAVELIPQPIDGYQYDQTATTWYTRASWIWWLFEIPYRGMSSLLPRLYKYMRA